MQGLKLKDAQPWEEDDLLEEFKELMEPYFNKVFLPKVQVKIKVKVPVKVPVKIKVNVPVST